MKRPHPLKAAGRWYREPKNHRRMMIACAALGFYAVRVLLEGNEERLNEIEQTLAGGTIPLDDVVSKAEFDRFRNETSLALAGAAHPSVTEIPGRRLSRVTGETFDDTVDEDGQDPPGPHIVH